MWRAVLGVLALTTGVASAAVISPAPGSVSVVIYHDDTVSTDDLMRHLNYRGYESDGLAMVIETREIDLPAGPSEIRFGGVASTMVPQTAAIDGLPQGVLEQNFDYNLLSPATLLAKSIGQRVHLIRTDRKTGKSTDTPAIIRSGPDGTMLDTGGKLEALRCSGSPERLVFDKAPDGLTDTPTLTVRTNAPVAGHYKIRLSYLATGIDWSADYVARIQPGGRTLDLAGWLTIANFGTTGFAHAPIFAVAGRFNATGDDTPVYTNPVRAADTCWPTAIKWDTHYLSPALLQRLAHPQIGIYSSSPVAVTALSDNELRDPRALGDYKLYTLPEPTDMPARETKQVRFFDLHNVPFTRVYRYRMLAEDDDANDGKPISPATVVLRLRNDADAGLGKPLPEGMIAVSEKSPSGTPVFVGQSPIRDTPVGLPFEIVAGETFGVPVRHVIADKRALPEAGGRTQRIYDIDIANDRAEPIAFELQQPVGDGDLHIVAESQPHRLENGAFVWSFALKPGEHGTLRLAFVTAG
jgi:hypothetical protein